MQKSNENAVMQCAKQAKIRYYIQNQISHTFNVFKCTTIQTWSQPFTFIRTTLPSNQSKALNQVYASPMDNLSFMGKVFHLYSPPSTRPLLALKDREFWRRQAQRPKKHVSTISTKLCNFDIEKHFRAKQKAFTGIKY